MNLGSNGGGEVLPQHARVPRGNSEQGQRRSFGAPSTLLPVAQGMDADSERDGELLLGQSDEAPKRDHIFAPRELSTKDSFPLLPGNRPGEVPVGQLTDFVAHVLPFRIL